MTELPHFKRLEARDLGKLPAGTGPRSSAGRLVREIGRDPHRPLCGPLLLACAPGGGFVVLDRPHPDRFRLARLSPTGEVEGPGVELGRGAGDPELLDPGGLAVDRRHAVFLSDGRSGCVKKFSPDGRWLATLSGPAARPFDGPQGVSVDRGGNLYVADVNNHRIVQFLADGEPGWILDRFALAEGVAAEEEFYEPHSVWAADDLLWVADTNRNRVLAFDTGRRLVRTLAGDDLFDFPWAVRSGGDGRSVYVCDRGRLRVRRFNERGDCTGTLLLDADYSCGPAADLAVDGDGRSLVIDPARERILLIAFAEA